MNLLFRIKNKINWIVRLYLIKDPQYVTTAKWIKDLDKEHLYSFNIDERSLVWDVGGYKGDWSERITNKYKSAVWIFEPVPEYFQSIQERFSHEKKAHIFSFGLFNEDKERQLVMDGPGTSSLLTKTQGKLIGCDFRDIYSFFRENGAPEVDLIKINVESDEYKILPRMIEMGIIKNFKNVLIQFHHWYPEAYKLRAIIHRQLSETHEKVFDYPFLWEHWTIS